MREEKSFYFVDLQCQNFSAVKAQDIWEQIMYIANDTFHCLGIEEYTMEEDQVDELLGDRSYSGGNLPGEVLEEIDTYMSSHPGRYRFYFYEEGALENAQNFQQFILDNVPTMNPILGEKENEDWNSEWRKHYKKISIESKLEICPAWEKEVQQQESELARVWIHPGMGFGTGDHETTWLCLAHLCSEIVPNFSHGGKVLDFGCGSGILGIAAARMLQEKIQEIALYDIDIEAIDNAQINVAINGQDEKYRFLLPHQRSYLQGPFKIIFANILLPVLLEERNFLCDHLEKGGFLVMSGILCDQVSQLRDHFLQNSEVKLLGQRIRGDWASCIWQKL